MTSETDEDREAEDPLPEDEADDDLPDGQVILDDAFSNAAAYRPVVAVYIRRPDTDEISDVLWKLLNHARTELGYELTDDRIETVSNLPGTRNHGGGTLPTNHEDGAAALYDADSRHPAGTEALIDVVTEHDVGDVVVESLREIGGVGESTRVVERLQDEDVTVHLLEDDLIIEPDDDRVRSVLSAVRNAAQSDANAPNLVTERGTGVKWDGGQPPRGLTVNNHGYLERGEDWKLVRSAAAAVESNEMTEYRASKVSGVSRHAIRTALNDYRDVYRVDEADPLTTNNSDAENEQ